MCKRFHIRDGEFFFFFPLQLLLNPSKLAQSISRGVEDLIANVWSTKIQSFSDLEPKLSANVEPGQLRCRVHAAFAGTDLSFEGLVARYLCGKGIPCRAAFDDVRMHFSPLVVPQLDRINDPAFRSEMLCWAATGSMSLPPTSLAVNIFVQYQNSLLIF